MIRHDIQTVFLSDEDLKGYIISDLMLRLLGGYKVWVEHESSCYDKNKQKVERFSNYCMKEIQSRLEGLGYHVKSISLKAEEMGMGWLDESESMVFCQREEMEI